MELMAYGAVTSSDMDPGSTGGEGSSERSVIGRREGDNCIIYPRRVSASRERVEKEELRNHLHNARDAAAYSKHLTPVSFLTPRNGPSTVGLAASGTSLHRGLRLLLLQRIRNE
jgi:hypothetical protein